MTRRKLATTIAASALPVAAHVPDRYTKQQVLEAAKYGPSDLWEWVRLNQPGIQAAMEEAINEAHRSLDFSYVERVSGMARMAYLVARCGCATQNESK